MKILFDLNWLKTSTKLATPLGVTPQSGINILTFLRNLFYVFQKYSKFLAGPVNSIIFRGTKFTQCPINSKLICIC